MAERVSAVADGDLLGEEGGDGGAQGFLGDVLAGEAPVFSVSAMDGGDAGLCGAGEAAVKSEVAAKVFVRLQPIRMPLQLCGRKLRL